MPPHLPPPENFLELLADILGQIAGKSASPETIIVVLLVSLFSYPAKRYLGAVLFGTLVLFLMWYLIILPMRASQGLPVLRLPAYTVLAHYALCLMVVLFWTGIIRLAQWAFRRRLSVKPGLIFEKPLLFVAATVVVIATTMLLSNHYKMTLECPTNSALLRERALARAKWYPKDEQTNAYAAYIVVCELNRSSWIEGIRRAFSLPSPPLGQGRAP